MKFRDKETKKLIKKKSSLNLKISLIIFILVISALTCSIIFFDNYIMETNSNYVENDTIHIIQVRSVVDEEGYREVNLKDFFELKKSVEFLKAGGEVCGFAYFLGSFDVENSDMIKVNCINSEAEKYLCNDEMQNECLYANDIDKDNIILGLQMTSVDEDGNMISDDLVNQSYLCKETKADNGFKYFLDDFEELKNVYVNENTFVKMLKSINQINEDCNKIFDYNNVEKIEIDNLFIYVNDIYEVEKFAQELTDEGYNTYYTLGAFENIGDSIKRNEMLFLIIIIVLIVSVATNLTLSFIGFINNQKSDIGKLKMFGFSSNRIKKIYEKNVDMIFLKVFLINVLITFVISYIIMPKNIINIVGIITAIIIFLLCGVRFAVISWYLNKVTKEGELSLLKG